MKPYIVSFSLLAAFIWACSMACWKPKHLCVSSHYSQQTCYNYMYDGNGNLQGMIPYECGGEVCDRYATDINPAWQGDAKCNKD